jgi:peptidoglycan hydrolase-like protein with peptidoglycan-binding domain
MGKHRRSRSAAARACTGAIAAVAVAAVAAGTLVLVNRFSSSSTVDASAAAATGSASQSGQSGQSGQGEHQSASSAPKTSKPPVPIPLHVVTTSPDGTEQVSGAAPIVVTFDEPVATTVLPQLQPAIAGQWSKPTPSSLQFDPAVAFAPDTKVTLTVPAGMQAENGGLLTTTTTVAYQVSDGSLLRLQQLLAKLEYLPVNFVPAQPEDDSAAAQAAAAFDPPAGDFTPRFSSTPQALSALWQPGKVTAVTTGAIMAFENVHGLKVDGDAGPAVWAALLQDAVDQAKDPQPYTWALTTMSRPETLQIWSDGAVVFSSKANTGIPAAPTPIGSWPVFMRYRSQTMKGTNPDGTKYNDPGVPFVNYFHEGDAIHGFKRASYGSQQSLGCIELPYAAASQVWDLIDYGTVVTVTR